MPQSLGKSTIHMVFSTKKREPFIGNDLERDLYAYICGICRSLKSPVYIINGMLDHVHILLEQHRTISISDLIAKIKANSSKWVKSQSSGSTLFSWQRGYGYFGVGRQQFDSVYKYIENQKERHKRIGFQDEVRAAYLTAKIEIDERYVWD
ncbi:MAG: IS200/IS605 family transposase [Chlamydiota bacterium]